MLHMETNKHVCLNCDGPLMGAYCHECGQKANTHRITVPHLIQHDLLHGLWHFDKGLLYTLREAFLRPGTMAINYIRGKRVRYYNVFYLILLVLGINSLVAHFFKQYYHVAEGSSHKGLVIEKNTVDVSYYIKHYFKLLMFLIIPLFALSGLISFRKLKLNFAEHAVIAGNLLLAGALWYFFVIVGMYSSRSIGSTIFNLIVWGFGIVVFVQPARVYYPAARDVYTKKDFALHLLQWYGFMMLLLWVVMLVIGGFTGKTNIKLG